MDGSLPAQSQIDFQIDLLVIASLTNDYMVQDRADQFGFDAIFKTQFLPQCFFKQRRVELRYLIPRLLLLE